MTDAARAWLESRRPAPPPSLAASMIRFVDAVEDDVDLADHLAMAALAALEAALTRPVERAGALDLLAADALLTYAFEAAAAEGTAAIDRVARRLDPTRLAELLDQRKP